MSFITHRKRRRRAFVKTPVIVDRYYLSSEECAGALGISENTLKSYRTIWRKNNNEYGPGPKPYRLGDDNDSLRYCIDDILIPSETQPCFLARMTQRRLDAIAAEQPGASIPKYYVQKTEIRPSQAGKKKARTTASYA